MTEKKVYTHEEAVEASTRYFSGDALAATAFVTKYALRDASNRLLELEPSQMHRRLAREFARIEARYPNPLSEDEIFGLLDRFRYVVPQGSPMSGIGDDSKYQSLSNCFVLPSPVDAYSGILLTDQQQVQIMKRRGGVGFDLSTLRPYGTPTTNTAMFSDGVPLFMERYSNTTREVAQNGRRGALLLSLDCRHPDLERFINKKRDLSKVTGANVSVRFTDEFMRAVESDSEFVLRWPIDAPLELAAVTRTVRARSVWEQFVDAAWSSAEPGAFFWDTVKRETPADIYEAEGFGSISTNPCGEINLSKYDACRLMVLNVLSYVERPFAADSRFDRLKFTRHVIKAQRLMDDLVDLELEAIDRILEKILSACESTDDVEVDLWRNIRAATANGRRTGLGVTAVGDAIAALGMRYGSDESIVFVEDLYKALATSSNESSVTMAVERGAFPVWEPGRSDEHPFMFRLLSHGEPETIARYKVHGRRNICLTTTAPVGTVSMLTQTTSGIEPTIFTSYKRKKKLAQGEIDQGARVDVTDDQGDRWQVFDVKHHGLQRWCEVTGRTDVENSPYAGATSADVDWVASVKLQAAAQRWVEHSISKTCNLPKDVTHETVSRVYLEAWRSGCKGFTVYRDGSRDGVITADGMPVKLDLKARLDGIDHSELRETVRVGLAHADVMPPAHLSFLDEVERYLRGDREERVIDRHAPKRPLRLPCDIVRAQVKGEKYVVLVGLLGGRPYEVFCGAADKVEVPRKFKSGFLVKNGKNKATGLATYNLAVPVDEDDELLFKDVASLFDNATYSTFTRMISLSLRHGVPVSFVCEQLTKSVDEDMQSFAKVVSRVLKQHIADGTRPAGVKTCDGCGSDQLVYTEGCVQCVSCGASKCS